MTISEKINRLTEFLSQYPLQEEVTELYNEIVTQLEIRDTDIIPIEDEKVKELWRTYEEQRFEMTGKRYTNKTRAIAIRKIQELAEGDCERFRNIIEWAITLGYADISPQILNYLETKTDDKGQLFKDSPYADFKNFMWFFHHKDYYKTCDFRHYYQRILSWSEAGNKRRRHWGFVALLFIENDIAKDKLVTIDADERRRQTITGTKLNQLFERLANELPKDIASRIQPLELYRMILTVQINYDDYEDINRKLPELKSTFYKYDIRNIEYKAKKQSSHHHIN